MIIDAHTHGIHGDYLEALEKAGGKWARDLTERARKRQRSKPSFMDPKVRVAHLDQNHIDMQVVTPSFWMDCNFFPGDSAARLAVAKALNENMARLSEDSRGRLPAGGSVPLINFDEQSRREMERAINTLGLRAISVPSNIFGKPLDSAEFEGFWASASEMDIPVLIHPANPAGYRDRGYEGEYDLAHAFGWPFETTLTLCRLVFSGIMERYPNLKILSHHLGGMIPFFWGRLNETYAPELQEKAIGKVLPAPLIDYFSLFYYDTAVGGSALAVKCAYEVFGADRLVFATDAPLGPGTGEMRLATYPDTIRSLGFTEAENRKIFEGNARSILKLS